MKKYIACVVGILLVWGGAACSDPGNGPVLGKTSILRLNLGLAGGVVSGMDVTLANGLWSHGHSAWPGGLKKGMRHEHFALSLGDRERTHDLIDSDKIAFPAGMGWANVLGKDQGWEFAIDLGIAHRIPPEMEFTAAGRIVSNGPFEEALIRGKKDLGRQLGNLDYYPVLLFGLRYRF